MARMVEIPEAEPAAAVRTGACPFSVRMALALAALWGAWVTMTSDLPGKLALKVVETMNYGTAPPSMERMLVALRR